MKKISDVARWSLVLALLGFQGPLMGQDEAESRPRTEAPAASGELPPPKLPPKKTYTEAEKKKECQKFEGQYISYYDRVYKVEKCKRREILTEEGDETTAILKGKKVETVDSDTIAKLDEGLHYGDSGQAKPNCAKLEGNYLLSRGDEVYFVEKCKKRLLPDWDTYLDHSVKRGKRGQDILELGDSEFNKIPEGIPFVSTLDAEFKKMFKEDQSIDVLPLAEACKGLNGKFMSYYSKIYRIEKCHKLPVDPELFLRRHPQYKMEEMTSEQWISIPTGKDFKM